MKSRYLSESNFKAGLETGFLF